MMKLNRPSVAIVVASAGSATTRLKRAMRSRPSRSVGLASTAWLSEWNVAGRT
jgi:hypothetical protein